MKPLRGSLVAVVTPMQADGALDFAALRQLLDWHIEAGGGGIVIAGTTGESPTLDIDEHLHLIEEAVTYIAGRAPVVAGVGGNATAEAAALSLFAQSVGADFGLSVAPYYNKPPQEGLRRHFSEIAEKSDLPTLLYNVPGRTVVDIADDTVFALSQIPAIVGIKDATGDVARGGALMKRVRAAREDFLFFSGDDKTGLDYMLAGGVGVISVTANVAPAPTQKMCEAALAGDVETARKIDATLQPFHEAQGAQSNPIPVKWALAEMKKISPALRLPLVELDAAHHDIVRDALQKAGALETD